MQPPDRQPDIHHCGACGQPIPSGSKLAAPASNGSGPVLCLACRIRAAQERNK